MGMRINRLVSVFGFAVCLCAASLGGDALAASGTPLPLSDMKVEILSQGKRATFRLYDTVAAGELYAQLPLELDLSNFRDAQWMFYPPEKLNVKADEAYHDGKKGELSYYAPWGDVFMLYKDFYAGDEMHRLGVGLSGVDDIAAMSGRALVRKLETPVAKKEEVMRITVNADNGAIVFELNDSRALRRQGKNLLPAQKVEHRRHPDGQGGPSRNPGLLRALGRRGDVLRQLRLGSRAVRAGTRGAGGRTHRLPERFRPHRVGPEPAQTEPQQTTPAASVAAAPNGPPPGRARDYCLPEHEKSILKQDR